MVTTTNSIVSWHIIVLLSLIATHSSQGLPSVHPQRRVRTATAGGTVLLPATSSRDLQQRNPNLQRLARATARAKALQKKNDAPNTRNKDSEKSPVGDLRRLTQVIDATLARKRRDVSLDSKPMKDSMSSLLSYNNDGNDENDDENDDTITNSIQQSMMQVVVVFGKSLIGNEITVEYASRLQRLATIIADGHVRPHVICFCGGTSRGNHVSSADAGFVFFNHLIKTHGILLPPGTAFFLDRTSQNEGQALQNIAAHIKKEHLVEWLATSHDVVSERSQAAIRKRVHVHFTLVSTDYHVCNLNDIHRRSPNQSLLRPLQHLKDDDHGIIETSWCFRYATYPFKQTAVDTIAFMGRCYFLSEQLLPLLMNMRAVVEDKEFFQRENYIVLATIRRGLVAQMEDLYKTSPLLRSGLRQVNTLNSAETVDIILEGALLSLGRCMDLVRPAGLHVGTVSKTDFSKALKSLEHCMAQIRAFCDPDQPLAPNKWGKLGREIGDGLLVESNNEDDNDNETLVVPL